MMDQREMEAFEKRHAQARKDAGKMLLPVAGGLVAGWMGFAGCMWIFGLAASGCALAFLIWVGVTVLQMMGVL